MAAVLEAFHAGDDDQPTCFIAYTVKGWGLPFAGHKDNHAGLMNPRADGGFPRSMALSAGRGVGAFRRARHAAAERCDGFIARRRSPRPDHAQPQAPALRCPPRCRCRAAKRLSTQEAFGRMLGDLANGDEPARRAHSHHLARRHGLDQSRRLGQSARLFARGRSADVPQGASPLGPELGARRRASISSSASPRTTCSCCWRRSAWPSRCSAPGCCRSARSMTRSSPAASMR